MLQETIHHLKKSFYAFIRRISAFDRHALVMVCTGGLFGLFGLIQLCIVTFSRLGRSYDHFFLIVVDVCAAAALIYLGVSRDKTVKENAMRQTQKSRRMNPAPRRAGNHGQRPQSRSADIQRHSSDDGFPF